MGLFEYFLKPFIFLFFFWNLYHVNFGAFNAVPEVAETIIISFFKKKKICSVAVISITLSSSSFTRFPASVSLLLIPSNVFLISVLFFHLCCLNLC